MKKSKKKTTSVKVKSKKKENFTLLRIFTIPAIQAFDNFIFVRCVLLHFKENKFYAPF